MATATKHISWSAVTNAITYDVELDTVITSLDALFLDVDLEENTSHAVRVRGSNSLGSGPWSTTSNFTVQNLAPPAVDDVDASDVNRGSMVISWTFDETAMADFDHYLVTATHGTVGTISGKQVTITGAPDSTSVTAWVKVVDDGGLESAAKSVVVVTPDAPVANAPPTPTNLKVTRIGYTSADFTWTASAGATSYEWSSNNSSYSGIGNVTSRTWGPGLAENTSYKLYVRAVGPGGKSAPASVAFKTLVKIKSYTPVYATRVYGYGQPYPYSQLGLFLYGSSNNFAQNTWATAADNNLNTGPYSPSAGQWITYTTSLNYDAVNAITAWFGYPGTFQWTAVDEYGHTVQQGRVVASSGTWGASANVINSPHADHRIARIQFYFYAGLGSPGIFKLREFAISCRVITSYTPVYNPA